MNKIERGRFSVMLVDDKPQNLRLLEKILIPAGFTRLVLVEDSREVVGLVKSSEADLVILDLNMPYLNGQEVMEQLQTLTNAPAVIFLTAHTDRDSRVRALESGARDFLTKPIEVFDLLSRVDNVLGAHLYQKETTRRAEILEEQVRERTLELADSRLDIIRRLGRAAEWRDNDTGLHIIRMSKMSQILALKAGFTVQQAELLLNASGMHDIGKIGIPDSVLLKPGKLDGKEWEIMKTHSQIGADLLDGSSSALMTMARDIALSHHEKWNGSGYPNGLAGEAIPMAGRIIAVADVFDALTSVRPYKKAWAMEDALNYLRENSGLHFDPSLVDLFIAAFDEIKPICERFADSADHTPTAKVS